MVSTVHIAQFDDQAKRELLKAVADKGRASGLEVAVQILNEMANHKRRVVGTTEIRDVAEVLAGKAREMRAEAAATMKRLEEYS